jgi:hypothetical protein
MIFTGKFEVPYFVVPLPEHSEIKESILKIIEDDNPESIQAYNNLISVHKTDYHILGQARTYYPIIMPYLLNLLKTLPNIIEFQNIVPEKTTIWYQQYKKLNYHPFHRHDAGWVSVYYLELDEKSPGTQFKSFFTDKTIEPSVTEGDVIVFPGWLDHKSPPNLSSKRKTVISCNYSYSFQKKK